MTDPNHATTPIDQVEAASRAVGWDGRYVRLSSASARGTLRTAPVGPMRVLWQETEGDFHLLGGEDREIVVFGLASRLAGRARWRLADLGANDLFTAPSAREFDLLSRGPIAFYSVLVPRRELAQLSGDLDRWFPSEGAWRSHLRLEPARADDLRELFECILHGPVDAGRARELGTLLMQSILTAADRAAEPKAVDAGSRASQADRARRYIEEHLARPLRVEDIAAAAGAGVRTLQRCFREVFGLTPLSYIKARRLDRVRRDLLAGGSDLQVSQAALAHGMTHMGRFSQEYRKMFGELPRETLARAKRPLERARPAAWADAGPAESATRASGDR